MPDKPHALLTQAQSVEERLDRRKPLALDRGGFQQLPQSRVIQAGPSNAARIGAKRTRTNPSRPARPSWMPEALTQNDSSSTLVDVFPSPRIARSWAGVPSSADMAPDHPTNHSSISSPRKRRRFLFPQRKKSRRGLDRWLAATRPTGPHDRLCARPGREVTPCPKVGKVSRAFSSGKGDPSLASSIANRATRSRSLASASVANRAGLPECREVDTTSGELPEPKTDCQSFGSHGSTPSSPAIAWRL